MKILVKCPTRVDLAGGTLDMWPLYLFVKNCLTINLSIDIFTQVEMEVNKGSSQIFLEIENLNYKSTFKNLEELLKSDDESVSLVKAVVEFFMPSEGFSLRTSSESPVGGGLGGSSSLCISLIKAFLELKNESMGVNEMVRLASNLEAKVLKTPTGCQDHYPPADPGLNFIYLKDQGPDYENIQMDLKSFEDRMFLVYTGRPHHSGINNWQVYKSVIEGNKETLVALEEIRSISLELKSVLLQQQWEVVPELFNREFTSRIKLASCFSSPEIEKLQKLVLQNQGDAVKICGAGGGGCVLVWTKPELKTRIMDLCQKEGFQVLNAKPVPSLRI